MRSHVFPVCKPGSKTFVFENKIEGGVSAIVGSRLISQTEDPDVLFSEGIGLRDGELFFQYDFLPLDKSEHLIDITAAPATDLIVDEGEESVISVFPFQINTPEVLVWEEINGKIAEGEVPPPGFVVCLGRKKNSDASWSDFSLLFLSGIFGGKRIGPFSDDNSLFNLDASRIKDGEWTTAMFTGTRWVALGSNNWF